MDDDRFQALRALLWAEVSMLAHRLDVGDELERLMAAGWGWGHGDRLLDAIEARDALAAFPANAWWR